MGTMSLMPILNAAAAAQVEGIAAGTGTDAAIAEESISSAAATATASSFIHVSPVTTAHRPRYPVDLKDPVNRMRLTIARQFGVLYLGSDWIVPNPRMPRMLLPVACIDPTLLRDPAAWLDLFRTTFFHFLNDKAKKIVVYDLDSDRRRRDPGAPEEPIRFHQPRSAPRFHETNVELVYARLRFEIRPDRSDLRVAQTEGMDAFQERMWNRFLTRLRRKLRQMEGK